ncbi:MAG: RidA family protein [Propionibacterium sp.]|nr:RidA family protein [Propionibacterium sp.]
MTGPDARPASSRLHELGLVLPAVVAPLAAYVPAARVGGQVLTSGQLPMIEGELRVTGKVGAEVALGDAVAAARICALNALAAAASVAGGVDAIRSIDKVVVYVASDPAFTAQPTVANGASQLFLDVFGEAGRHVRSAVGVRVLPLDAPVEVELTVSV